jgi:CopG-like RHH_1 or ribbon-helix-helix domain, RHH_5
MVEQVAKKLFTSVPDGLAERLQQRAEEEGRTVSSLLAYFAERMMEDWQPKLTKRTSEGHRYD